MRSFMLVLVTPAFALALAACRPPEAPPASQGRASGEAANERELSRAFPGNPTANDGEVQRAFPGTPATSNAPVPPRPSPTRPPPPSPAETRPACPRKECPPEAPGMPNFRCPDGQTVGGPRCVRKDDGVCVWTIVRCP
jgi:hypothetical protein